MEVQENKIILLIKKGGGMGGIISLIILILDVIAIIDVVKSSMEVSKKFLWILLIVILPVLGLILYYLLGKKGNSLDQKGEKNV